MQIQGPCTTNIALFPFNPVECSLTLESLNYNIDDVDVAWAPTGMAMMNDHISPADFDLREFSTDRRTVVSYIKIRIYRFF